jgi:hypothetical protein
VFINFASLPNGTVTYSQYTVAAVRTQTTLVLTTGLSAPITVPTKFQLQANYTSTQQATTLAGIASGFQNRRVRLVFPDTLSNAGVTYKGYYLAAALAGLRAGNVANQGLTNSTVLGFDTVTEATNTFSASDLNIMAASGVLIVTQTVPGAELYVRDALTTDVSSLSKQQEMITSNVDSISYQLQGVLNPFIGKYNVNSDTITLIKTTINNELVDLMSQPTSASAGTQLLDGSKILSIAQDPQFKNKINVAVSLNEPYSLDDLIVNLEVA